MIGWAHYCPFSSTSSEECVNEDNENGDYLLSYHDFEVHLTVVETFLFVAFFVRL